MRRAPPATLAQCLLKLVCNKSGQPTPCPAGLVCRTDEQIGADLYLCLP